MFDTSTLNIDKQTETVVRRRALSVMFNMISPHVCDVTIVSTISGMFRAVAVVVMTILYARW